MKTRTLMLICTLCLAVLIILGSCATTMKTSENMMYEKFCGTWANETYEGEGMFAGAKWIFNPDGTFVSYMYITDTGAGGSAAYGAYTVEKRWTDPEGNSWYNITLEMGLEDFGTRYIVCKLSHYNSVIEGAISNIDFPDKIDRTDKRSDYFIFYRF